MSTAADPAPAGSAPKVPSAPGAAPKVPSAPGAAPKVPSAPGAAPEVPALPPSLADPRPVMAIGTVLWTAALVVVGVRALLGADGLGATVATCTVGVALGAIGYGIFFWQRRTVRGGSSRGQQGIS